MDPASQFRGNDRQVRGGSPILRFGPFEADEDAFELRRDGQPLCLPRQVLEVVLFFIKTRGVLVTKADLIQGPWRGTVVGEAAVARAIMLARRALSSGEVSSIVTVRGKGYRFIGGVTEVEPRARSGVPARARTHVMPNDHRSELHRIHAGARRATRGLGSVVLVGTRETTPEAELTELTELFATEVAHHGLPVARVRASETPTALPLAPWLDLVRIGPRPCGIDEVDSYLISCAANVGFDSYEPLICSLFRRAYERPWVVCMENLQRADEHSMLLLALLCRCIAHVPLLIVATCSRPELLGRFPLHELLEVIPAQVTRASDPTNALRVFMSIA